MNTNPGENGSGAAFLSANSLIEKKTTTSFSNILVTGGTGFLGAYIINNLVQRGYRVTAIQRSIQLPFFIPAEITAKVNWIKGNILDVNFLNDIMKGIDAIFHTAALVSFSKVDRKKMYDINIEGTANIVNLALENNIKKLVHISSVAALGRTTRSETINESKKWEESKNNTHYSITKYHAEMHVWRAFAEGLNGCILNPSTILGYGNWHQSSCAIFKNAYREFPWYTNGVNGFVGVEDVAEAAVQVLESEIQHQKFIVNSENWSFQKLFDTIATHFNKKKPNKEASALAGEVAWRVEKLRSLITGSQPLLTKETAKVAQSKTSFSNEAILQTLPGFTFTPLEKVVEMACKSYSRALQNGILTL